MQVSIPFKRESISKVATPKWREYKTQGFNSLQTGKHIQSLKRDIIEKITDRVSIPFKRESISKVKELRPENPLSSVRFNSLQTGKHIQSKAKRSTQIMTFEKSFNSLQTGKHIQREIS